MDYATLRLIWWLLLGILLIAFAVMDGFDLGVGTLLPFVAKKEEERRVVINSVGPVWEGNQVWFILGGGAIFAAWPTLYAVSFSGFYFAMLLVLLALIIRPIGFKYRSKLSQPQWRSLWDRCLCFSGFVPALLFGVALGNVIQGVPFYFDNTLRDFYTGSFFALLNPFAILCGLVSVTMLVMHGGAYLSVKTTGDIQCRAIKYARWSALVYVVLFALAGVWVAHGIMGYVMGAGVPHDGPSNPMLKQVTTQVGAWMNNYRQNHYWMIVPALGFVGALLSILFLTVKCHRWGLFFSGVAVASTVATVGVSMFPFILPSSSWPNMSLSVWDSSSSAPTLSIMLIAAAIFVPIILAYTTWIYYVLRGKVTAEYIERNDKSVY